MNGAGYVVLEVRTRCSAAGTTVAMDTVSRQGRAPLRLERIGAHRCRNRNFVSEATKLLVREGIQDLSPDAYQCTRSTNRRIPGVASRTQTSVPEVSSTNLFILGESSRLQKTPLVLNWLFCTNDFLVDLPELSV